MALSYFLGTNTLLFAMMFTADASTFGKYFAIKGTQVEGSWQMIRNTDKDYKCCLACEQHPNCTAVNYNADNKTCKMMFASENGQFSLTSSPGWNGYFTDLKDVNPLWNAVATQSSNYSGVHTAAELAIDGNTDGYLSGGSCSHTGITDNHWWMVDFRSHFFVSAVLLWNRIDTGNDPQLMIFERLQGLTLSVGRSVSSLDYQNNICGYYRGPPLYRLDNPIRVNCTRVTYGRFLKIEKQLSGTGALSLCEVQVVQ